VRKRGYNKNHHCEICNKRVVNGYFRCQKHSKIGRGKDSRPYQKTGKIVLCQACRMPFYAKKHEILRDKKFCSRKCWSKEKVKKNCLNCKKEFCVAYRFRDHKFCSKKCDLVYRVGKCYKRREKQPPLSEEIKKRMREESRRRRSENIRGEKSPTWKGGRTKLQLVIRDCFKYRQWRSDIFTRDRFTCQLCGATKCYVEAHHFIKFSTILDKYKITSIEQALECEELWNINNGQTLCRACHDRTKLGRPFC